MALVTSETENQTPQKFPALRAEASTMKQIIIYTKVSQKIDDAGYNLYNLYNLSIRVRGM